MDEYVVERTTIAMVEKLEDFDDEYVYDIGMASNDPYFFANDILVHNSCYFSAYEVMKDDPKYAGFDWSRENIIALYDMIVDEANETFPDFLNKTFNIAMHRGKYITAGRELIGSRGIFIKKKKYAILMFDKEGKRLDVDGSPGELKVMGLDLKRADTPKYMQDFLEKLLMDLLTGTDKAEIYNNIKEFRKIFKVRPGWEKGSPKKVSDLTKYIMEQKKIDSRHGALGSKKTVKLDEKSKVNLPGHVRASMNWNTLCEVMNDKYAMPITDGTRIIVCKLSRNSFGMTSVAYPIDEPHLPQWFLDLPFDDKAMEEVIIDNKIMNIVEVLDWDLTDTREKGGDEFFSFG